MATVTWTEWLLLVPLSTYALAAAGYGARGEWGLAVVYAAYAAANGGLIWAALAGRAGG